MEQTSSSPRHFVIVGVLIVISTIILNWLLLMALPLPVQASIQAVDIDWLFDLHMLLIAFLFSLVVVFMGYALVVFRRRDGDDGDGEHFEGNTKLEIIWTTAPMIFVIIFSVLGITSLNAVTRAQDGEVTVKVVAQQWSFLFYHEDGTHEAMETLETTREELVLAVDQPVIMKMRSKDVLHAFWVPEFRVKQDILPSFPLVIVDDEAGHEAAADAEHEGEAAADAGHEGEAGDEFDYPTELRFTPSKTGIYRLRCAELCGTSHFSMRSYVYVVEAEQYEEFLNGGDIVCIVNDTDNPKYASRCN